MNYVADIEARRADTSRDGEQSGTARRPASRPWRTVRLRHVLLVFTLAVPLLSIGSLIAIQWWSASRSTEDLLRRNGELMLDVVETAIAARVGAAEQLVTAMASRQQEVGYSTGSDHAIRSLRWAASSAAPHISSVAILQADTTEVRIAAASGDGELRVAEHGDAPRYVQLVEKLRTRGEAHMMRSPATAETAEPTHLEVWRAVWMDGQYRGAWGAAIPVGVLETALGRVGRELGGTAFVDTVSGQLLAGRPLGPGAAAGGGDEETALTAGASVVRETVGPMPRGEGAGVRHFRTAAGGSEYVTVVRSARLVEGEPWRIGLSLDADMLDRHADRNTTIALAGGVILLLSITAGLWLSRTIASPLATWGRSVRRIAELEFDEMPEAPRNRVRELDDVARSFNTLVQGLRTFETYVPRKLVRQLLRHGGRSVVSAERELTVMFTDIVGFTSLSEGRSPAGTAEMLNEVFSILGRSVERFDGTIDKYIGDALLAFWGAPEELQNTPEKACLAALEIARRLEWYNRDRRERGEQPIRLRIGIHHGPVVVGNIGAPGRVDYTIIGDTVNACQRIEALAADVISRDDVTVLVSETVVSGLPASVGHLEVGTASLRGRRLPLKVYKLV